MGIYELKESVYVKDKGKAVSMTTKVACRWAGAGAVLNRSPKGNMWSAIPIALLGMFVTVGG